MTVQELFSSIRLSIEEENYTQLKQIKIFKPEKFNWVKDIFEPYNVAQLGTQKGLIWKYNEEREDYTFQNLADKYNQFLNYLRNKGIVQGDKMFSQVPLLPITWIGYLASIKGGLIIIPAATTLEARDLTFRFESSFPEVALADQANASKIDEAEAKFDKKIKVKLITEGEREGWININELWKESIQAEAADTKPDDDLFYFFTSGTTGMPKVVVHTHYTYPLGGFTTSSWVGMKKGDLHYNISQPGWAKFFWSSFFAPWNMGATILGYHSDKFVPKEQLQTIQDLGVTTFCAPPTALRVLILEDLKSYDFKLRQCVAAGEPLNPEIIDVWKEGTGITIRDGYGQSESTAMIANLPNEKIKYGSMGKPAFLYDIVIADDDGNIVQDCEDGYVWFVGRDDDVIKASDFRVGPFEVESALLEHDAIMEAAVVASPHDLRSNAVKAFVILAPGNEASEELAKDIFRYTEEHLARYKIPRIVQFVESLPKTISGKIRRVELRNQEAVDKKNKTIIPNEYFHEKY